MAIPGNPITQAELDELAGLANTKLAPAVPYGFSGAPLQQEWDRLRNDLLENILEDAGSPLHGNKAALVSARQVVGVNPCPLNDGRLYLGDVSSRIPATGYLPFFKEVRFYYADYRVPPLKVDDPDITAGDAEVLADGTCLVTLLRKLRFDWSDTVGVFWAATEQAGSPSGSRTVYDRPYSLTVEQPVDVPAECRAFVELVVPLVWQGGGIAMDPTLDEMEVSMSGVDSSYTFLRFQHGVWSLVLWLWKSCVAGAQTLTVGLQSTGYWCPGGTVNDTPLYTAPGVSWPETPATARGGASEAELSSTTFLTIDRGAPTPVGAAVIHPAAEGKYVAIDEFAGTPGDYQSHGARGVELVEIKPGQLRGVWTAKTLPTPAMNGYLDQDLPPYISQLRLAAPFGMFDDGRFTFSPMVAVGGRYYEKPGGSTGTVLNPRTSVRQAAPYDPNIAAHEFVPVTLVLAPGEVYSGELVYPWWLRDPLPASLGRPQSILLACTEAVDWFCSDAPGVNPGNPDTYQLQVPGVAQLTSAAVAAQFGDGLKRLYFVLRHTGPTTQNLGLVVTTYTREPSVYQWVEPSVGGQVAVWPVIRDTDEYPLYLGMDFCRRAEAYAFELNPGDYGRVQATADPGARVWELESTPAMPLYLARAGTASADHYELYKADGKITLAELVAHYGPGFLDGGPIECAFLNGEIVPQSVAVKRRVENYADAATQTPCGDVPVFLPSANQDDVDDWDYLRSAGEAFSFNIVAQARDTGLKAIPLRGHCIYAVLVRREPVLAVEATADRPSIYLPPTAAEDLQPVTVKLGQYVGTVHTSVEAVQKGDFVELLELTLAAGALEAWADVFWPVVWGAPLVYQCAHRVRVEALVHGRQYACAAPAVDRSQTPWQIERGDVDPSPMCLRPGLRHRNYRGMWADYGDINDFFHVQFPPAAAAYNDLKAALELL
jgi:hypothetical protein